MRLTQEDIDALTPTLDSQRLGMPSLQELDYALSLIMKRYPVDAWYLRRRLKWLVRRMDKHYGIKWTTPWRGRRWQD